MRLLDVISTASMTCYLQTLISQDLFKISVPVILMGSASPSATLTNPDTTQRYCMGSSFVLFLNRPHGSSSVCMPALSEMKSWYDRLLYGWMQNEESICVMCSCKVMLYSPDAHRKTFGTLRYFSMIYPLLIRTHSSFCDQSYCFLSIVRHCGALQSVIWGWKKTFGFAKAYNGL